MEIEAGKLFIGGISWDTTEERLREYFEDFGEVLEAVIMKDRTTGRARGFGFVVFANASVAEKVVRERHIIDGRTVEAKKAVPRDDYQTFSRNSGSSIQGSPGPTRTKKIFVGGLASTVTESDFKRYFDQFGTITDVVVMYDHNTQRPRGFGFITYDSEEAVDKVLFKTFHELNGKMVEVKRAVPKELSPGPTRSPSYNYGLNRVGSTFLNAYTQVNSPNPSSGYGMRMDGRFSPVPVGRIGYPNHSPSGNIIGPNSESGFNFNYGDSGLGYGHGVNSYFSGNSGRYGSPISYNGGGSGSLLSNTNRNLWGNGNPNYGTKSISSNDFIDSGSAGEIWGWSPLSAMGGGDVSLIGGNIGGGGGGYARNNGGGTIGSTSFYSNARGGFENSYGGDSFFMDQSWNSPLPELESATSFGYGRGNAAADVTAKNSVGYVGGYSVSGRSNRGIAA